jgi:hypothetical protein
MANKKLNLLKGSWLILLCIGVILLSANYSRATTIPINVYDILFGGPSGGTGYYTEYWLDTEEFGVLDAFCVEDHGLDATIDYALVDVPTEKEYAAKIASRYFDGSILALDIINTQTEAKVSTQLAIWDVLTIFEYSEGLPYYYQVQAIEALADSSNISDSIYLAQSPVNGPPGPSQDYLVSVPDASIMLLLGSSLMGLAVFSRKSKKS